MLRLLAKIASTVACAIILTHAVVPHCHHDSDVGWALVFEDEINCPCDDSCDGHDGHTCDHRSHHPFDICTLQQLLAHLVISGRDDEEHFCIDKIGLHDLCCMWTGDDGDWLGLVTEELTVHRRFVPSLTDRSVGSVSLRAPPFC